MSTPEKKDIPLERSLVVVTRAIVPAKKQPRLAFEYLGIVFDPSESVGEHGGRPIAISEVKIQKLEQAFSFDATIKEACFYTGISPQTYFNWVNRWPKLLERFDELRQNPLLIARQTIVQSLKNPQMATWYLERKAKKEFRPSVEIDQSEQVRSITFKRATFNTNKDEPANTRG